MFKPTVTLASTKKAETLLVQHTLCKMCESQLAWLHMEGRLPGHYTRQFLHHTGHRSIRAGTQHLQGRGEQGKPQGFRKLPILPERTTNRAARSQGLTVTLSQAEPSPTWCIQQHPSKGHISGHHQPGQGLEHSTAKRGPQKPELPQRPGRPTAGL